MYVDIMRKSQLVLHWVVLRRAIQAQMLVELMI